MALLVCVIETMYSCSKLEIPLLTKQSLMTAFNFNVTRQITFVRTIQLKSEESPNDVKMKYTGELKKKKTSVQNLESQLKYYQSLNFE